MMKQRAPRQGKSAAGKILAPPACPLFSAAIRYRDGSKELMRIKNAIDIDDAREVAMGALVNVHLILIAELKQPVPQEEP